MLLTMQTNIFERVNENINSNDSNKMYGSHAIAMHMHAAQCLL